MAKDPQGDATHAPRPDLLEHGILEENDGLAVPDPCRSPADQIGCLLLVRIVRDGTLDSGPGHDRVAPGPLARWSTRLAGY